MAESELVLTDLNKPEETKKEPDCNAKDEAIKKIENKRWRTECKEMIAMENNNENCEKIEIVFVNSDDEEETHEIPYDNYFRSLDAGISKFGKNAETITMKDRMADAAPYNIFFTMLPLCPETKEQLYSISFTDLFCPSFGKLKCSLHITFMAEIEWLLPQLAKRKLHKKPMTLIYGSETGNWPQKETLQELYPNIDCNFVNVKKKEDDLGCHHTKLSIFVYEDDSLRLVIGSANLYGDDWSIYNQQVWISPPCPKLTDRGNSVFPGESPTGFKCALFDYLGSYENHSIPSMKQWIDRVLDADFSDVKVALLFTTPGVHYPRKNGCFIHFLGHLLSRDCTIPAPKEEHDSWTIVAQTSALGLVGRTPDEWLTTQLLKSLGSHKDQPYFATLRSVCKAKFNLIYPTVLNSLNGYLGIISALCCPYDYSIKKLQPWLLKYKCQWKADGTKRTRAISHSKCYLRISPCWEKIAYYFLTSANLSRSAWGTQPNRDSGIYIRSYEMGVLFLPKYFGEEYFEVKDTPNRKNKRLFPLMFDVPLVPYGPKDDSICYKELLEKGLIKTRSKPSDSDSDSEGKSEASPKSNNQNDAAALSKEKSETETDSTELCAGVAKMTVQNKELCDPNVNKDNDVQAPKKDLSFNVKPNNLFFPSFKK